MMLGDLLGRLWAVTDRPQGVPPVSVGNRKAAHKCRSAGVLVPSPQVGPLPGHARGTRRCKRVGRLRTRPARHRRSQRALHPRTSLESSYGGSRAFDRLSRHRAQTDYRRSRGPTACDPHAGRTAAGRRTGRGPDARRHAGRLRPPGGRPVHLPPKSPPAVLRHQPPHEGAPGRLERAPQGAGPGAPCAKDVVGEAVLEQQARLDAEHDVGSQVRLLSQEVAQP